MPEDYQKYLDPKIINKIGKLDLQARMIVEGYISGLHKSPYHGYSVEFAQHREYSPGDDTRHLDWKVYAKSDRFYIKEYEEETNLITYLLVDMSESMRYGSGDVTKMDYANYIAASLAYLVLDQSDAVGLTLFDDTVKRHINPTSNFNKLRVLLHELSAAVPQERTNMGVVLHELAEKQIQRRGIVVIISDCFDDPDEIIEGMTHFCHKRHEVILFHVMDEFEKTFPFKDSTLFIGLEGYPEVRTEPRALRNEYLEEINNHIDEIKRGCRKLKVDYVQTTTDMLLDAVLSSYLSKRAHMLRR